MTKNITICIVAVAVLIGETVWAIIDGPNGNHMGCYALFASSVLLWLFWIFISFVEKEMAYNDTSIFFISIEIVVTPLINIGFLCIGYLCMHDLGDVLYSMGIPCLIITQLIGIVAGVLTVECEIEYEKMEVKNVIKGEGELKTLENEFQKFIKSATDKLTDEEIIKALDTMSQVINNISGIEENYEELHIGQEMYNSEKMLIYNTKKLVDVYLNEITTSDMKIKIKEMLLEIENAFTTMEAQLRRKLETLVDVDIIVLRETLKRKGVLSDFNVRA